MLVFVKGGKPENPEKNPRSKARSNNKLNPLTGHRTLADQNLLVSDEIPTVLGHDVRQFFFSENRFTVRINKTLFFAATSK